MFELHPILIPILSAAGVAVDRIGTWIVRRLGARDRAKVDRSTQLSEDEGRFRRELIEEAERCRRLAREAEEQQGRIRADLARLQSVLTDERAARHHCQERLTALELRLGRLEECVAHCSHTQDCPIGPPRPETE